MSASLQSSAVGKKAALDAQFDLLNSGPIKIYSGTRPTNPDTAISGNTLLATLTFGATAFAAASNSSNVATKTANAITSDTNAAATGAATWARMLKSDGTTVIADINVGTSAADMIINSTAIQAATTVSCSSLVITAGG